MKEFLDKKTDALQRFARTDIRYIYRGGFWLGVAQFVTGASVFALSVAFANLVPQSVYGTYKFILSYGTLFLAFSLTGIGDAIVREAARGNNNSLLHGFVASLKWSFFIALGGLAFATYYYTQENTVLAVSFFLLGIILPFKQAFGWYESFLEGKKNFRFKALTRLIYGVSTSGIMIGALFLTQDVVILVSTYLLIQLAVYGSLFFVVLRKYHISYSPHDSSFLRFSKHLSLMNILAKVSSNADKLILFHTFGAMQLAVYSFALAPVKELNLINHTMKLLAMPKISKRSPEELQKHLPRKVFLYFLLYMFIIAIYWIAAPFLYQLLFPKYLEAVFISQITSLLLLFAPFVFFKKSLIAHKYTRALYVIQLATPIARIVGLFTLIPIFGIIGAVLGLLVGRVVETGLATFYFFKMK